MAHNVGSNYTGVRMKILVINDNLSMTETLRTLLEPLNAEIIVSGGSSLGKEPARFFDPDLIILDITLPELDGWQVCRLIRNHYNAPILILSAADNPSTIASALDAGGDDYMIKPVTGGMLLAHINKLLRRSKPGSELVISPMHI